MTVGLLLQAGAMFWIWQLLAVDVEYLALIPSFVMAGTGMSLVFAPSASMILESVRQREAGQASGALATLREVGGVLGVAVMATMFQHGGSYASPQAFTDGVSAALPAAVGVLLFGALLAALLPGRAAHQARAAEVLAEDAREAGAADEPQPEPAAEEARVPVAAV